MLPRPIALVLLFALVAAPADAQLGGLAKKIKDRAKQAAAEKAIQAAAEKAGVGTKNASTAPTYDDVILELTAPRVDALLRGLAASQSVLTANGGIPAILKEREALEERINTLDERANAVSSGYNNARNRWSSCEDDARASLEKSHEAEVRKATAAMIANPAGSADRMRNATAYQQELANAVASGDSVALKKATANFYKIWGIDLSKDDALVASKCGAPPAMPQAMVDLDRANARRDSLDVKARAIENRAVLEGSKASGLTEQQFAMARERAQMAVTGTRDRFSKAELAALDAKKSELLVYLKP